MRSREVFAQRRHAAGAGPGRARRAGARGRRAHPADRGAPSTTSPTRLATAAERRSAERARGRMPGAHRRAGDVDGAGATAPRRHRGGHRRPASPASGGGADRSSTSTGAWRWASRLPRARARRARAGLIEDGAAAGGHGRRRVTRGARRSWSPRGTSMPDDGFARMLRRRRACSAVAMPTISIAPPQDTAPLDRGDRASRRPTAWIVFTSAQAVAATCGHARVGADVAAAGRASADRRGRARQQRRASARFGLTCDLGPAAIERARAGRGVGGRVTGASRASTCCGRAPTSRAASCPTRSAPPAPVVTDPEAYRTVAVRPSALGDASRRRSRRAASTRWRSSRRPPPRAWPAACDRRTLRAARRANRGGEHRAVHDRRRSTRSARLRPSRPTTRTGAGLATAILRHLRRRRGAAS